MRFLFDLKEDEKIEKESDLFIQIFHFVCSDVLELNLENSLRKIAEILDNNKH